MGHSPGHDLNLEPFMAVEASRANRVSTQPGLFKGILCGTPGSEQFPLTFSLAVSLVTCCPVPRSGPDVLLDIADVARGRFIVRFRRLLVDPGARQVSFAGPFQRFRESPLGQLDSLVSARLEGRTVGQFFSSTSRVLTIGHRSAFPQQRRYAVS